MSCTRILSFGFGVSAILFLLYWCFVIPFHELSSSFRKSLDVTATAILFLIATFSNILLSLAVSVRSKSCCSQAYLIVISSLSDLFMTWIVLTTKLLQTWNENDDTNLVEGLSVVLFHSSTFFSLSVASMVLFNLWNAYFIILCLSDNTISAKVGTILIVILYSFMVTLINTSYTETTWIFLFNSVALFLGPVFVMLLLTASSFCITKRKEDSRIYKDLNEITSTLVYANCLLLLLLTAPLFTLGLVEKYCCHVSNRQVILHITIALYAGVYPTIKPLVYPWIDANIKTSYHYIVFESILEANRNAKKPIVINNFLDTRL